MRKYIKENLLYALREAKRLNASLQRYCGKNFQKEMQEALTVEQELIIQTGNQVEEVGGEQDIIAQLEECCELIWICSQSKGNEQIEQYRKLNEKIEQIEQEVMILPEQYEIVFLPYKASMWDSLESVWRTAKEDPECTCHVIPIPYFEKKVNGMLGKMHYEGEMFPEDVPITDYEKYDLEKNHPEIIFFHNPYDQYNRVTTVHPDFYSSKIYQYTEKLVYIPYFIAGYYASVESAKNMCIMPAAAFSDVLIMQSQKQRQLYEQNGVNKEKLVVLGNPKADAVKYYLEKMEIPDNWKKVIKNKKVFLLNSSISRILNEKEWMEKMRNVVESFSKDQNMVLIWRPHPLLLETIEAMCPQKKKEYEEIYDVLVKMPNAIIDEESSAYGAVKCADALISDYSSLALQFSLTGKPVLMLVGKEVFRETKQVCFDYFSNYFLRDGMSVESFCEMVKQGKDEKKTEREQKIRASMANIDGQCGKEIFHWLKEKMNKGEH